MTTLSLPNPLHAVAGIHSCSAERAAWADLCLATAARGCETEAHGRAVPQQHGCTKKNRESARPASSDCAGSGTAYREAAGDASAVCQQQQQQCHKTVP